MRELLEIIFLATGTIAFMIYIVNGIADAFK